MPARDARWDLKSLLAFATIYFVWGSTFLAIRVGVRELPPLLFASMRFTAAGLALLLWTALRREIWPTRRQWLSILVIAALFFLCDYGLLFWAEQRVPSGIAAVLLATIPACIAIAECLILRTRTFSLRLTLGLLVGLAGVAILVSRSFRLGSVAVDRLGAGALLCGAVCWALGTILTRVLPLPDSRIVSSGAQMFTGGVLLAAAALPFGELRRFHPAAVSRSAWLALLYLIVAGSLIGFTAYLWLLHRQSPTRVGTYAYVNPLVAVLLGYFAAAEPLGARTLLGTVCILVSVIIINLAPRRTG